jgi:hypothetical protein
VTFSRQSCRSVHENATPTDGSNSFIITEPSFENQGTTLAQVSGAGVGKRNWMPHLVKFLPRRLLQRVRYSRNLDHKNQIQTMKRLYWLFVILAFFGCAKVLAVRQIPEITLGERQLG